MSKKSIILLAATLLAGISFLSCDKSSGTGGAFKITLNIEGKGTANANQQSANEGDNIILTATPTTGYSFIEWEVTSGGATIDNPTDESASFSMPAEDVAITARFSDDSSSYSVTVTSSNPQEGSAQADKTEARPGQSVTIRATPEDGYIFDKWVVLSGTVIITDLKAPIVTFTMPDNDLEIEAQFIVDFDIFDFIDDPVFKAYVEGRKTASQSIGGALYSKWDSNGDGKLSSSEVTAVTAIDLSALPNVASLNGIEKFAALEYLNTIGSQITELNLTGNTELKTLLAGKNYESTDDIVWGLLRKVNVSECSKLEHIDCTMTDLTGGLDLSGCPELKVVMLFDNEKMRSLNIENCTKIEMLNCIACGLSELDVTGCPELLSLECNLNNLRALDITQNAKLRHLTTYSNRIREFDFSNSLDLNYLVISTNDISEVDLTPLKAKLTELICSDNPKLTALNLNGFANLSVVYTHNCSLTSLDVEGCTALMDLYCFNNKLSSLDASNMSFLPGTANHFSLRCGGQTDITGAPQNLSLSLREEQRSYWESRLSQNVQFNSGVTAQYVD